MLRQQDRITTQTQDHRGRDAMVFMQGGGDQFGVLSGFAKVAMPAAAMPTFVQLPAGGCGDDGEQESWHACSHLLRQRGGESHEGSVHVREPGRARG